MNDVKLKSFTQIPNEVLYSTILNCNDKLVYSILASFNPSFPSIPYISILLDRDERCIMKSIKKLEKLKLIIVNRKIGRSNQYLVNKLNLEFLIKDLSKLKEEHKKRVVAKNDTGSSSIKCQSNNTNINNTNINNTNINNTNKKEEKNNINKEEDMELNTLQRGESHLVYKNKNIINLYLQIYHEFFNKELILSSLQIKYLDNFFETRWINILNNRPLNYKITTKEDYFKETWFKNKKNITMILDIINMQIEENHERNKIHQSQNSN